jgi:hypothetical protein
LLQKARSLLKRKEIFSLLRKLEIGKNFLNRKKRNKDKKMTRFFNSLSFAQQNESIFIGNRYLINKRQVEVVNLVCLWFFFDLNAKPDSFRQGF